MTLTATDGFQPRPLKKLFTTNQCWAAFLEAGGLRDIEIEAVTKMLACGTRIRRAIAGLNVQALKAHARDISLMRYVSV